jgi:hypothetical protein
VRGKRVKSLLLVLVKHQGFSCQLIDKRRLHLRVPISQLIVTLCRERRARSVRRSRKHEEKEDGKKERKRA